MLSQNRLNSDSVSSDRAKPQALDTVDRLALYITGAIALNYPEIAESIVQADHECTPFFHEKLADVIRQALPSLDIVELERLQDAARAKL